MDLYTKKGQKGLNILRYVIVVVVAVVIVGVVAIVTIPKQATHPERSSTPSEQGSDVSDPTDENVLSAVEVNAVSELIESYYQAKTDLNMEKLKEIVIPEVPFQVSDLQNEKRIIEKYDRFQTYVLPSNLAEYFIVYVTYDIYFNGLDTGAPSLNHFVVKRQADGTFVICNEFVNEDFEQCLSETEKSEKITELKSRVEQELLEACEENEDLKALIDFMESSMGYVAPTTAPTEPENTDEPETVSENGSETAP